MPDAAALGQQLGHRYPVEVGQLGQAGHGHGAVATLVRADHDGLPAAVGLLLDALQGQALLLADGAQPRTEGLGVVRRHWNTPSHRARRLSPAIATERDGTARMTRGQVLLPTRFGDDRRKRGLYLAPAGRAAAVNRLADQAPDQVQSPTSFNDPSREAGKEVRCGVSRYDNVDRIRSVHRSPNHADPPAKVILTAADISRIVDRIAHQILEKTEGARDTILLGIPDPGRSARPAAGRADPRLRGHRGAGRRPRRHPLPRRPADARRPAIGRTDLPTGGVDGKRVILVDDVLFSGRTVRAALDALGDLGRPRLRAARGAGRPRPPGAADPRRLRRQEHPDRAGGSGAGVLTETDGADECSLHGYGRRRMASLSSDVFSMAAPCEAGQE